MPELIVEIPNDQVLAFQSLIDKLIVIESADIEAMYLGTSTIKLVIKEAPQWAIENLPSMLEDARIALEWQKLTNSRKPLEYLGGMWKEIAELKAKLESRS